MAGAVSACSPEFNWREARSIEQGFMVLLPGRPASMSREIDLDGLRVTMTMTGARVDRALFTVGAVQLDSDDAALRDRALSAMRIAMLRNIGAEPRAGAAMRVGLIDGAGASLGAVDAIAVEAQGTASGEPVVLQAVFAARRDRLWQAVAITPPAQSAQARTMIESFKVIAP